MLDGGGWGVTVRTGTGWSSFQPTLEGCCVAEDPGRKPVLISGPRDSMPVGK